MDLLDVLYKNAVKRAALTDSLRRRFVFSELQQSIVQSANYRPRSALLLSGVRGVGKSTLMLQLFRELKNSFFFSADSILLKQHLLYDVVEKAHRQGYKVIFIDEIHVCPDWALQVKNVYDDFGVRLVCSGSSTAAIAKGALFLGRRGFEIPVNNLTLGEYYYLQTGNVKQVSLDEAFDLKKTFAWLAVNSDVEKYYKTYLESGGFPVSNENNAIFSLMRKMIYQDALTEFSLTDTKVDCAERILAFLASSKPGEFSYTSFSNVSGYAKSTVFDTVGLLCELKLLRQVAETSPKSKAKKTTKLLFAHPNLRSAVASELNITPDIGALREEFFLFHMANLGFKPTLPAASVKNPDYECEVNGKKTLFEIGGDSKTKAQFTGKAGVVLNDENLKTLGFCTAVKT